MPSIISFFIKKIQFLKNHQGFRKYFSNTSWILAEQILRMITGLFVAVWVARYLGPTQFGIFSYAIAFTSIFTCLAKLGLDGIVVRELIREPEKTTVYLGTIFWLKFMGGCITIALIFIATLFTSNNTITNFYILIIASGIIFQSFETIDFYFQSQVLSKFVAISKLIQLLLSSCLKIYFILIEAELIWFVFIVLFDQISLAISLLITFLNQKIRHFYCCFDLRTAKQLLKDSWPLILSSLMIMIYMRIDQIMIKEMLGEKEVGLYSAAVKISEVWYFIPMLISTSLFPAIINAKKISEELYYARLQKLYTLLIWIAIIIALLMTFFSNYIIKFLYGSAYQDAGKVLIVHCWTGIFTSFEIVCGKWFLNENLQFIAFIRIFYGTIINILLNLFIIPIYKIQGAAISTLISYIIIIFSTKLFLKKKILISMQKIVKH